MKKCASIVCLAALLMSVGCGGGSSPQPLSAGIPPAGSPPPQSHYPNESWHFTAESTDSPAPGMEGALLFDSSSVSGIVHITLNTSAGGCFFFEDVIQISGTVDSGNKIHLVTSAFAGEGQTVTIDATLSQDRLSMLDGTYKIDGPCANGSAGTITARRVNALDGHYIGTLASGAASVSVTADLTQAQFADPISGYFPLTGTLTVEGTQCVGTFSLQGSTVGNYVDLNSSSATGLEGLSGKIDPEGQQISLYDYLYSDDCTAGYSGTLQRQ